MTACTCDQPLTIGRLIRHHYDRALKNLDLELEVDTTGVITSSVRCKLCRTLYVVSTVVATIPPMQPTPILTPTETFEL